MRQRPSGRPRFGGVKRVLAIVSAVVVSAAPVVVGASHAAGIPATSSAAYRLSATALFMGGTGQPLIIPPDSPEFVSSYVNTMYTDFVAPTGLCRGGDPGCTLVAVYTPEQLGPLVGEMTFDESVAIGRGLVANCIRGAECIATLDPFTTTLTTQLTDTSYVVFGQSQSAIISSYEKSYLIAHPPTDRTVSFVLLSNQGRPNGGVAERFVGGYIPILGITFNGATQTNSPEPTPLKTVDIAAQYDGWADFPTNPLNLLASLNAVMGAHYLHPNVSKLAGNSQLQGFYQDSTYYLLPNELLPLVIPLSQIPLIGLPLARALDPPLRVLVEAGYDRTINPGQPTPAKYLYFPNPIKTLVDFLVAIPTGWDDAIATITGNPDVRPFHTKPQPAYGVGGPPIYAGAVDPYGPIDPPDSVAEAGAGAAASVTAKPAAAEAKSVRARRHAATAAEPLPRGPEPAAGSDSSNRGPRPARESQRAASEKSPTAPSNTRVRPGNAA